MPKRIILHERAKFYLQLRGVPVESFHRVLHKLIEACKFPMKHDDITDRLVIGLQNETLVKRLQRIPDLKPEDDTEVARGSEKINKKI